MISLYLLYLVINLLIIYWIFIFVSVNVEEIVKQADELYSQV